MRPFPTAARVALAAFAAFACSEEQRPAIVAKPPAPAHSPPPAPAAGALEVTPIRFPFSGTTVQPNVVSDGSGGFLVSWIEKSTSSFIFAPYRGGNWFQPRMITHGRLLVNRADFPSIAVAPQGLLYAQWIETKGGEATSLRIARSTDNGATWSVPLRPHADVAAEFGFASLLPSPNGAVELVWLDGEKTVGRAEGEAETALRHATIDGDGKLSEATTLDARVCDCCQTAAAMTESGPIVAYRDRSSSELRDISFVRAAESGWSQPKPLHADGWKIAACPVNGPQLDADGKNVVAAWFTAAGDEPRVKVAFSNDGGATFGKAIAIDEGAPIGHVDVALLADGDAIVTWVERAGEKGRIAARLVRSDGTRGGTVLVSEETSASAVGFPRLAVSKQNVAVVWNGSGAEPSVRIATIKPSAK